MGAIAPPVILKRRTKALITLMVSLTPVITLAWIKFLAGDSITHALDTPDDYILCFGIALSIGVFTVTDEGFNDATSLFLASTAIILILSVCGYAMATYMIDSAFTAQLMAAKSSSAAQSQSTPLPIRVGAAIDFVSNLLMSWSFVRRYWS